MLQVGETHGRSRFGVIKSRIIGLAFTILLVDFLPRPVVAAPPVSRDVSVAQLCQTLRQARRKHDERAAKEIYQLRLTERLSSPKLATLSAQLGPKAKAALMSVGDSSVFLAPPADEIPARPTPSLGEQRHMVSVAIDYLKRVIPKLPDFYASRLTTAFERSSTPNQDDDRSALEFSEQFKATVYYRSGKEVVHPDGPEEVALITEGVFGPILSTVIIDASHSTTKWARWEDGPTGTIGVFRFQISRQESHYRVSFPTFAALGSLYADTPSAYHGEFAIDPSSGTILRLVLVADPDSSLSRERAEIMVEYGQVLIGGQRYTCPIRSVSIAASLSPITTSPLYITRMDDVSFSGYHVFRADMRILPN